MDFTADIISEIEQALDAADDIVVAGRDRPLDFHWRVPKAAAARTGWNGSGDRQYDTAMRSIMAALVLAGRVGEWVSYSRRREWYRDERRYQGLSYTYARIVAAVDELLALGLIEEERARPGDHRRTCRQSRMRATEKLIEAFAGISFEHKIHETIRLRDERGDLVDYKDTAKTIAMRRDMECLNRALSQVRLELLGEGVSIEGHLMRVDGAIIRMTDAPTLYRVFSRGKWTCGGRIYCWVQNLPASRRADLRIDGEAVVELDYASLHPRMLYAKRGAILDFDPYDIDEFERALSKRALLVAFNASTLGKAVAALMASTSRDGTAWPLDWPETRRLVDAVIAKNPIIAADIGADVGIGLMHDDAELAMRVVKACAKRNITCLPVHDSFIVQRRHEATLQAIMDAEIARYETRARAAFEASKKAAETVVENSVVTHCNIDVIRPVIPHNGVWGVGGVGEGSANEVSRDDQRPSAHIDLFDFSKRPTFDRAERDRRIEAHIRGETRNYILVPGELEHALWPMYRSKTGKAAQEWFEAEWNSWEYRNSLPLYPPLVRDPWYAAERKRRLAELRRSQVSRDRPSGPSAMQ